MKNDLHVERLRNLLDLLENNLTKPLTSLEVAEAACYSYRNINRIFKAVFHKSIGRYIKELLLQEAALQLVYSDKTITDIAFELHYSDLQAFNKAFRREFDCSPSQFRQQDKNDMDAWIKAKLPEEIKQLDAFAYTTVDLPTTHILYLTHYGNYGSQGIEDCWEALIEYAYQKKLLTDDTRYLGELMDDDDIVKDENCRYNAAITLPQGLELKPEGFFNTKTLEAGQYVVVVHKGDRRQMDKVYEQIFLHWMVKQEFEIADRPLLEFYLNDEADTAPEDLLTEIYVPV